MKDKDELAKVRRQLFALWEAMFVAAMLKYNYFNILRSSGIVVRQNGKKLPEFALGISGTADLICIAGLKVSKKKLKSYLKTVT